MKIKGIVKSELETALARVNGRYSGNLKLIDVRDIPRGVQFGLRVCDSHAFGARLAPSGRHTPSASWEAHRDLYREVFKLNPAAVIHTMYAVYRGAGDFEAGFEATGRVNLGSPLHPVTMPALTV